MNRKKDIEHLYLENFLRLSKRERHRILGKNERPDGKEEEPDFLANMGEGIVGIEVTALYKDEGCHGSPVKAAEVERSNLLQNLASAYYSQGGRPLAVDVILTVGSPDPEDISNLAALLRKNRPEMDRAKAEFEACIGRSKIFKFYLTALPDQFGHYCHWQIINDSVGWVRTITSQQIVDRIQEKAGRLQEYQKAADDVLLLLVADRVKNSGKLDFSPPSPLLPSCGFREVHLLLYPLGSFRVA